MLRIQRDVKCITFLFFKASLIVKNSLSLVKLCVDCGLIQLIVSDNNKGIDKKSFSPRQSTTIANIFLKLVSLTEVIYLLNIKYDFEEKGIKILVSVLVRKEHSNFRGYWLELAPAPCVWLASSPLLGVSCTPPR